MLERVAIEKIIQIARDAGQAILQVYDGRIEVEMKDDRSPLTQADKNSNIIIVDGLKKLYPDIPFISEESKQTEYNTRRSWKYFWLIDTLDGTKEFIKRNGEFTVNIALVEGQVPVLGVIYVPVKNIVYFASRDGGAWKISGDGAKQPIRAKQSNNKDKLVIVGSRSHATQELEDYVAARSDEYRDVELISSGSSLKFCLVAEGDADVYPRTGPTMEWDTAAGHALVLESGRQVHNFGTKEPLVYNKEDLRNGWFIVE